MDELTGIERQMIRTALLAYAKQLLIADCYTPYTTEMSVAVVKLAGEYSKLIEKMRAAS